MKKNVLFTISYDGSKFHGWQIQANAMTVQEAFQNALYRVLKAVSDIKACSRTDTGVHARMFCISVVTESNIPTNKLVSAINHYLPTSISALTCEDVAMDFHARYSCKGKEYIYEIWNSQIRNPFLEERAVHYWYKIDENQLAVAAAHYVGTHDFTSFCTIDKRDKGDLVRTIYEARVERDGNLVRFIVSGNGFLYNMVRIMVGTLLKIQEGKLMPEDIPKIIEEKNRKYAGPTAPAHGLYLNRVFY